MNPMNGSPKDTQVDQGSKRVSLNELADLTGFPVSMIREELKLGKDQEIDLEELRTILSQYLDKSFVLDNKVN